MAFKITFSKTAVDDFFNGAIGARFKIERGRGMICPTNSLGDDVIEFVSRNRGGTELSFLDKSFEKAQKVLDGGEMVFFTLEETATDWIELIPYTEAGAPEKFKPVARFWDLDRKSSYIPVAERDNIEIRRPVGRPRKIVEAVQADVPKRGPGRPKKIVEAIQAVTAPVAAEAPIKRGPGRPKKIVTEQVVSAPRAATPVVKAEPAPTPVMVGVEASSFTDVATAIREAYRLTEQAGGRGRPSREVLAARELVDVVREVAGKTLPQVIEAASTASHAEEQHPQFAVMMIYPVGMAHPKAEEIRPIIDVFSRTMAGTIAEQKAEKAEPARAGVALGSGNVGMAAVTAKSTVKETPEVPTEVKADSEVSELVYVPDSDVDVSTLEENASRAAKLWKENRRSGAGNNERHIEAVSGSFPKRANTRTIIVEDRRRQRQMA